jgi:hypothetical protein
MSDDNRADDTYVVIVVSGSFVDAVVHVTNNSRRSRYLKCGICL